MRPEYADVAHSVDAPGDASEIADFVDWKATAAFRTRLGSHGFGIAEAMDTAQRFELGWPAADRLIEICGGLGLETGFVAGASTDHLGHPPGSERELVEAVAWQCERIREHGGVAVLLPMVWLLENGYDADGFVKVHERILERVHGPLILHWLGPMFLASLQGYFPGDSFARILALDPTKVRGCKLSLLDDAMELGVRRSIADRDQVVFTGDDFHFGELVLGGDPRDAARELPMPIVRVGEFAGRPLTHGDFSHALLGIFDAIARPFGVALELLAQGDVAGYRAIAAPCEALGQHVFEAPTQHYKAGLAFLSWLNGYQDNAMLVNHAERCRDRGHYVRLVELASAAGAIEDADTAAERLQEWMASW